MTDEKFKVKPIYKFLLMQSILQNIKICETLMIICFLEKFQSFAPTIIRKTKKIPYKTKERNKNYHKIQEISDTE